MKKFFRFLLKIILIFVILSVSTVVVYRFIFPPITPIMAIRAMSSDSKVGWDYEYKAVPLEEISPNMVLAAMGGEDDLFLQHHGFNWDQIQKAREESQSGKRERGGSTISQQCAKNVFLTHRHSYVRKAFEAYFTVLIECIWGKQRIMEVYLNVIEFGDGIYGIEAASQHYYNKSAKRLTKYEASMLAAVLPNPLKRNPLKETQYMVRQSKHIRWMMGNIGTVKWE